MDVKDMREKLVIYRLGRLLTEIMMKLFKHKEREEKRKVVVVCTLEYGGTRVDVPPVYNSVRCH